MPRKSHGEFNVAADSTAEGVTPGASFNETAVKAGQSTAQKPAKTAPAPAPSLTEGSKAPAFQMPRDGGQKISLSDYSGRKLVIFFYPRADTPGCTKEAIDFTRLSDEFAKAGTSLLGVSADPSKAQEAFRDKHRLSMALGSDESQEMLKAYGVWGENRCTGRPSRAFFVQPFWSAPTEGSQNSGAM